MIHAFLYKCTGCQANLRPYSHQFKVKVNKEKYHEDSSVNKMAVGGEASCSNVGAMWRDGGERNAN